VQQLEGNSPLIFSKKGSKLARQRSKTPKGLFIRIRSRRFPKGEEFKQENSVIELKFEISIELNRNF